jgi:hypothetical protein
MLKGGVKMAKFFIISLVLIPLIFICMVAAGQTTDEKIAFVPVDHTYIYDVNDDGSVRCTWSTTIIPKEPTILYTYSFRGGRRKTISRKTPWGR